MLNKILKTISVILLGSWFAFSFLQIGSRADENEHCHAAWLIAVQGLRPFRDFFQHHSPMLWDFLGLYYKWGGTGPAVLFWGRAGVVVANALLIGLLWRLSQRDQPEKQQGILAFLAAILFLISSGVMMAEDFVIRPETLAIALFAVSLWLWREKRTPARFTLSALLFGLAAFASPRAVLLAPLYGAIWFTRPKKEAVSALALFTLLSAAAFFAYAFGMGHSLPEYWQFVLIFTAKLQKIGPQVFLRAFYWDRSPFVLVPLFLSFAALIHFFKTAPATERPRMLYLIAACFACSVAGVASSYPHVYPQNLMMGLVFTAILLIDFGKDFAWPAETKTVLAVAMIWLLCAAGQDMRRTRFDKRDVFSAVKQKEKFLRAAGPRDTVLLPYDRHPIAIRDASYYAGYIESYENRQGRFVEWAQTIDPTLPDFDLLGDLKREKPLYLCPRSLLLVLHERDKDELIAIRRKWYKFVYPDDYRWEVSFIAKRQEEAMPWPRVTQLYVKKIDPMNGPENETP